MTKQQRLIRHPDALCALGALPALVEEWYSACRAAFLALLRLPATGVVRFAIDCRCPSDPACTWLTEASLPVVGRARHQAQDQREQVHDSIKGLNAFMAELGDLADRSELINVLTSRLPVLSPLSPFSSVRSAHRLLSAAAVIIPFALPGEEVGGHATTPSTATPSPRDASPAGNGAPSEGTATPATDGTVPPRLEVAIGSNAHDGGDPSRRNVPPDMVIVLQVSCDLWVTATLAQGLTATPGGCRCAARAPGPSRRHVEEGDALQAFGQQAVCRVQRQTPCLGVHQPRHIRVLAMQRHAPAAGHTRFQGGTPDVTCGNGSCV